MYREGQNWTVKHFAWLRAIQWDEVLETEDQVVFGEYLAMLEYKLDRRDELDRRIEALALEPSYKEAVGLEDEAELDSYEWPAFLPPFHGGRILVDGMRRAWVRRHREADGTLQYDLFDDSGAVVLKVELDSQRRVVGFGDGTLYAVRMDEQGLQYLERYALP